MSTGQAPEIGMTRAPRDGAFVLPVRVVSAPVRAVLDGTGSETPANSIDLIRYAGAFGARDPNLPTRARGRNAMSWDVLASAAASENLDAIATGGYAGMLPSEWIFRFAAYVRGHNAMLTMAEAVTLGRAAAEDGHWLSHGPEEVAEQALRDVMGGSMPAQFIDTVPDVFGAQSQS